MELFGISTAARRVGCSEGTLRAYEARGVVSPMRDSQRRRLFRPEDLEAARAEMARTRHEGHEVSA